MSTSLVVIAIASSILALMALVVAVILIVMTLRMQSELSRMLQETQGLLQDLHHVTGNVAAVSDTGKSLVDNLSTLATGAMFARFAGGSTTPWWSVLAQTAASGWGIYQQLQQMRSKRA